LNSLKDLNNQLKNKSASNSNVNLIAEQSQIHKDGDYK
jgi:hypothetical protein